MPRRRARPSAVPAALLGLVSLLLAVAVTAAAAITQTPPTDEPIGPPPATEPDEVALVLFHSATCPHCARERAWLAEVLLPRYPDLRIDAYEITSSADNRARFAAVAERLDFDPGLVPTTVVGDRYWIGFSEEIATEIETVVAALVEGQAAPTEDENTTVDVPLLGSVDVGDQSLLVATVLIGLLDGVNPCSLWVLSLLLALVVHTGSRRRVFAVGAVFLAVTTALYALYVAGLYSVLSYVAYVVWIRVAVALVAGAMGTVNLLDALGARIPIRLRIPEERKPDLYKRMRVAARGQGSLPTTLGATAALAIGVSLIETPCTAGFPVMWSNLVSAQGVGAAGAALLFSVYMLLFLLDELAVFGLAVVTLRATKLQEKEGALLKLAGGVVMLTLAAVMIFAPDLLESITGTLVVFGAAALATLALAGRIRRPSPGSPSPGSPGPGSPGPRTPARRA